MNITLINHYAGSNRHGMEYRPFYLAREWVRCGHQVTIVAASYSHLRTQGARSQTSAAEEEIEGIRYVWLRTPAYRGNGAARVINMLAFVHQLLRQTRTLAQRWKPDAVIASSTYPLDVVPASRIARNSGARLIFEVHDLWPLTPIHLGGMSPRHPFIVLLQWAENFAYRNADRVVSLLPKADSHMRHHGMAAHKFAYLPNGIDIAEWQSSTAPVPPEHLSAVARLRQEDRFLVGYAGAHGVANSLHTLVDAAHLLQAQPVAFVLVGQGPEKDALEQRARRLGLTHMVFLPPVSRQCIPELLASTDALFMGSNRCPIYRFGVSPNKLVDYMMAGRPVIHATEAANDSVRDSGCGISVPPEDPPALAQAIQRLMNLAPAQREAMGLKGKEYVLARHDYRVLAQHFISVMQ